MTLLSEEERTPQELAREWNVKLHGMTDEQWDTYLLYLEEMGEFAEASKRLLEEADDLHAAFHADKFVRPQNREQRRRLWRSLRELRTRRLAELRARYEELFDV